MWIFTQTGFISVVQKRPQDPCLTARSRDKISLMAVCKVLKLNTRVITQRRNTDYEYRMPLTKDQLKIFLEAQVNELDYSNFKDRVTQVRGPRWHDALMDVWVAMLAVSRTRPYYRAS